MGKSLKGKELGRGISQRKDGLYQARFTNRFGNRETIYAKTYNKIQKKLREAIMEDEKEVNVVSSDMTLDEWFVEWLDICKKNCRENTKNTYTRHYKRIQKALGWRKLSQLNLVVIQKAINDLRSDNERKNSKKILSDMLEKAIDADLIAKNVARQVNTVITKEEKHDRRVLTIEETELFLDEAKNTVYYDLFVVALETGMRIGELTGLQWSDIDFKNKVLSVKHSMTYFSKDGKYVFEMHSTKTETGVRSIPLTAKAITSLHRQQFRKQTIVNKGKIALEEYKDLVFVTRNNKPTTQFLVTECMDAVIRRIKNKNPDIQFDRLTPHTFRHTFATRCLEAGVPLKTVSALLGHKQLQLTTDLYVHVTDEFLVDGVQKFENYNIGVG